MAVQGQSTTSSSGKPPVKYQLIKDPIHGSIEIDRLLSGIIKTPAFHRLKYIQQLSGLYYVYPGARHTRYEHSIGVCYLAGEFARMLIKNMKESISEDDEKNILSVQIAGLCHDLGHGPFSHLFDSILKKRCKICSQKLPEKESRKEEHYEELLECHHMTPPPKDIVETLQKDQSICSCESEEKKNELSHEYLSTLILKQLIFSDDKAQSVENLKNYDVKMIQNMIDMDKHYEKKIPADEVYLYEIVANKKTGIDVDKWDYFIRDCHYMGLQHEFDYRRLMQLSRVEKDKEGKSRICYSEKETSNILGMFRTRCMLHHKAYKHRKGVAVNHILSAAIEQVLDIKLLHSEDQQKSINDILDNITKDRKGLQGYLTLNDSIIHIILNTNPEEKIGEDYKFTRMQKEDLRRAQALLKKLESGHIPHRLSLQDIQKSILKRFDLKEPPRAALLPDNFVLLVPQNPDETVNKEKAERLLQRFLDGDISSNSFLEKCLEERISRSHQDKWLLSAIRPKAEEKILSTFLDGTIPLELLIKKSIIEVMKNKTAKNSVVREVVSRLKHLLPENDKIIQPECIFTEKVKLSYGSESEKSNPMHGLRFYEDTEAQKDKYRILEDEEWYQDSLRLFSPEKFFLEEYWWYSWLEDQHDEKAKGVIAEVLLENIKRYI